MSPIGNAQMCSTETGSSVTSDALVFSIDNIKSVAVPLYLLIVLMNNLVSVPGLKKSGSKAIFFPV